MNLTLPGNPRYQPKSLVGIFGYDNLYKPVIEVELAALHVLGEIGVIPTEHYRQLTPEIEKKILEICTTDVDELERRITKHDIRALVRLIQDTIPDDLKRWVHIPLTSYDPLEAGRIIQYARAYHKVIAPKSREIIGILAGLVRKYAGTLQIGRTHGQHAIPITVGFWLATVLSRIIYNCKEIEKSAFALRGKISGAVGASNAVRGLGIAEKCGGLSFEGLVLHKLGITPAYISTQILPPEPLAYFLFSNAMLSASFGQLGRDCRHLMRSEIAEIGEPFAEGQVGSSTMAQKRNPINFENLEGMWLRTKNEFGKVLDTLISEHQRDLVGSSVARDFPIIIVNLVTQMETLLRKNDKGLTFLERLTVNEENCERNLQMSENFVLAEPLYIALQMAGYKGDAHELINRKAMPLAQERNEPLLFALNDLLHSEGTDLTEAMLNIPSDVLALLADPKNYTGDATAKAIEIADMAEEYLRKG
jgi:adenylosuccinate lyase